MTKNEFLEALRMGLSSLPEEEIAEHISFYSEMIDDRIEEGLPMDEAVEGIGNPESIAFQIMREHAPLEEKKKEKTRRKIGALEIVLLVLGSPIWLSLLIAVFSVIFSLYVVLWSVIASFWAVAASFVGVAIGGFITSGVFTFFGNVQAALAMFGIGILSLGLFILGIIGCIGATKGAAFLTKKSVLLMISPFRRKEN